MGSEKGQIVGSELKREDPHWAPHGPSGCASLGFGLRGLVGRRNRGNLRSAKREGRCNLFEPILGRDRRK